MEETLDDKEAEDLEETCLDSRTDD